MKVPFKPAIAGIHLAFSRTGLAEDVLLPAPVLQWSFYIFLIFALSVAIGIFLIRKRNGIPNEQLRRLIGEPSAIIHSVGPETTVSDCVKRMTEEKIGAMLVMEGDRLQGIFTERDTLARVVGAGLDPATTKVKDVMTRDPYCVTPETTLEEAMHIVTHNRFRHLPVVEKGTVLGMVSSGDLTYRLVTDRPAEVRELVIAAGRRRASLEAEDQASIADGPHQ